MKPVQSLSKERKLETQVFELIEIFCKENRKGHFNILFGNHMGGRRSPNHARPDIRESESGQ